MPSAYPSALDSLSTSSANSTPAADTHPALHNDANAAINAVQSTLGTNPQGGSASVSARLAAIESSIPSSVLQVDYYAGGSGTWTKAAGARLIRIYAWGPGGSGGGGAQRPSGTGSRGGGGGSGGGFVDITTPASSLGATESYVVGEAGAAGVGGTSADSAGTSAAAGTNTTFGSIIIAKAGDYGHEGGTPGTGAAGTCNAYGLAITNSGGGTGSAGTGGAGATPATSTYRIPMAGGGGGGLNTSTTQGAGGAGGAWGVTSEVALPGAYTNATAGAIDGGDGAHGTSAFGQGFGGAGGGAGSTDGTIRGGDGGNGGFPGGGGGGGAGSRNGARGGNGGAGGGGLLIVVQLG